MSNVLLSFNSRFLTPFISRFSPRRAYRVIRYTGGLGKGIHKQSFRFDEAACGHALDALCGSLQISHKEAKAIIEKFHRIETRVLFEHIWLAKQGTRHISDMIDMEAAMQLSRRLKGKNPAVMLTAHTAYYFLIPWALHELGAKVAYVMSDPRASAAEDHMLTGVAAINALSRKIPIVFTNEGSTVNRCIELIQRGYSLLMVIDVPGYSGRGNILRLFSRDFWVPSGCEWICKGTKADVLSVFSYMPDITEPYGLEISELGSGSDSIDLQAWADGLERIAGRFPESWLGWFYLKDMG